MAIHFNTTDNIQGIGPSISDKLSTVGIDFLSDFFIYNPQTISLHTGYSVDQIEKWRAAAAFLEIEDMTPDWVEALVGAGKHSYDQFLYCSMVELETIFQEALANSIISEVPDTELIYLLSKRISRALYGFTVQGYVKDAEGNPIEDAKVSIAQYKTKTNSKGYWRFSVMNAKSPARLFVKKKDYETLYDDTIQLNEDHLTTEVVEHVLTSGTSADIVWDEFLGDTLPELTSFNTSTKKMDEEDLRDGDLLRVHKISDSTVRLVSVYSKMVNQTFTVLVYEVDKSRLSDAEINTYWKYQNEEFTLTQEEMGTIAIMKKTKKFLANPPKAEEGDDMWSYYFRPLEINIIP